MATAPELEGVNPEIPVSPARVALLAAVNELPYVLHDRPDEAYAPEEIKDVKRRYEDLVDTCGTVQVVLADLVRQAGAVSESVTESVSRLVEGSDDESTPSQRRRKITDVPGDPGAFVNWMFTVNARLGSIAREVGAATNFPAEESEAIAALARRALVRLRVVCNGMRDCIRRCERAGSPRAID